MAPNGNTRWPHTALLTRSTSGPERQYRWPPKAQILNSGETRHGHDRDHGHGHDRGAASQRGVRERQFRFR